MEILFDLSYAREQPAITFIDHSHQATWERKLIGEKETKPLGPIISDLWWRHRFSGLEENLNNPGLIKTEVKPIVGSLFLKSEWSHEKCPNVESPTEKNGLYNKAKILWVISYYSPLQVWEMRERSLRCRTFWRKKFWLLGLYLWDLFVASEAIDNIQEFEK